MAKVGIAVVETTNLCIATNSVVVVVVVNICSNLFFLFMLIYAIRIQLFMNCHTCVPHSNLCYSQCWTSFDVRCNVIRDVAKLIVKHSVRITA